MEMSSIVRHNYNESSRTIIRPEGMNLFEANLSHSIKLAADFNATNVVRTAVIR